MSNIVKRYAPLGGVASQGFGLGEVTFTEYSPADLDDYFDKYPHPRPPGSETASNRVSRRVARAMQISKEAQEYSKAEARHAPPIDERISKALTDVYHHKSLTGVEKLAAIKALQRFVGTGVCLKCSGSGIVAVNQCMGNPAGDPEQCEACVPFEGEDYGFR